MHRYEFASERPLARSAFALRLAGHLMVALALLVVSMAIGMAGYSYYENLHWRDAFLNASMLLGAVGPVDPQKPTAESCSPVLALYAGLVFIISAALIVTPLVHRVPHVFHWKEKVE